MKTAKLKVKAQVAVWSDLAGVKDRQWVLPCTATAYDAMVMQIAEKTARIKLRTPWNKCSKFDRHLLLDEANLALKAIGINPSDT